MISIQAGNPRETRRALTTDPSVFRMAQEVCSQNGWAMRLIIDITILAPELDSELVYQELESRGVQVTRI
jgi:hypothetical protein